MCLSGCIRGISVCVNIFQCMNERLYMHMCVERYMRQVQYLYEASTVHIYVMGYIFICESTWLKGAYISVSV